MASYNKLWFSIYLGMGVVAACAESADINDSPAYTPAEPVASAPARPAPAPASEAIETEELSSVKAEAGTEDTTATQNAPGAAPIESVEEVIAEAPTPDSPNVDDIEAAPEAVLEEARRHSTGLDSVPAAPIAEAVEEAQAAAERVVEEVAEEVEVAPAPEPADVAPEAETTSEDEPEPAPEPVNEPTPAPAPAPLPDAVLASGDWVRKTRRTQGTWSIVRENGSVFVRLDEDFSTRNAPDLKIFLSPISAADVGNENAINGAKLISLLDSNKGAQSYAVPDDVDIDDYASILIHCEAFTKLWSAADLR